MASTFGPSSPANPANQKILMKRIGSTTKSTNSRPSSPAMADGNSNFPTPIAPSTDVPAATAASLFLTTIANSKNPNSTISSMTSAKPPMSQTNIPQSS